METENGHSQVGPTATGFSTRATVQAQIHLSPEKKVDLLLKEYDSLRNEIVARVSSNYIVLSCFVVLAAAFIAIAKDFSWRIGVSGSAATLGLCLIWWNQLRCMARCSRRVIAIEEEVNKIVGEDVLVWEQRVSAARKYQWFFPGKL